MIGIKTKEKKKITNGGEKINTIDSQVSTATEAIFTGRVSKITRCLRSTYILGIFKGTTVFFFRPAGRVVLARLLPTLSATLERTLHSTVSLLFHPVLFYLDYLFGNKSIFFLFAHVTHATSG